MASKNHHAIIIRWWSERINGGFSMKKHCLTVTALLCVICGALAGCKSKDEKYLNDPSVLNITVPDYGYGTEWLLYLADGFTAKTGHKVNVKVTTAETGYVTSIRSGKAQYDIYVVREQVFAFVNNNQSNYTGRDCVLANYDELYNSEVPGEGIKFKDKMKDVYEMYNRTDTMTDGGRPHYYGVQWCDTAHGFVKNLDVWDQHKNWKNPNTTDELIALSQQILTDGCTPFIYSYDYTYWWNATNVWISQYEGLESMLGEQGFWRGYDTEGNQYVPEMWLRDGILEGMRVLDEICKESNHFNHKFSRSIDFTTAQGYFLIPSQNIAMMANGDWLYREMSKNYANARIEMIKTPIVSAIRNHPDCEGTIADDAELSALIKAIDNGQTALVGEGYDVSQKAYDKVAEARNLYTCSSSMNHVMVSPSYSDSLDLVKEFFLYMATDEGLKQFARGSGGFTPAFKGSADVYSYSDSISNDFVKSSESIKRNKQVAPWPVYSSLLFTMGGLAVKPVIDTGYDTPEKIFVQDGSGYMTADQLFAFNYQHACEHWAEYLTKAGLLN